MNRYTLPVPLDASLQIEGFRSGTEILDRWLIRRALTNQLSGASRTFVSCPVDDRERVVGFYSLAAAAVALADAPGHIRRNMPDPVPVILLGRLAVDGDHQGFGLGASLLQDAVLRVAGVANTIGVRALLVHSINDSATAFYRRFGFVPSQFETSTLFLSIQAVRASLGPVIE